jgi:hypothetical protein
MSLFSLFRQNTRPPDAITRLGPGDDDYLSLSQAYSNAIIFGQTGSAKTTGVAADIALGLLRHPSRPRPAALILCQKPDEAARWSRYAQLSNRSADVIHAYPGGRHCIDILDYETSAFGGGIESAKSLLGTLMEVANRNRQRNSADSYWPESSERKMGYAMTILRMAGLACGLREVLQFCQSLPSRPEQLKDANWLRSSFAINCLISASESHPNHPALELAAEWVLKEWPELSEKTRSIIQSVTLITLDKLLSTQFADLLNGDTTFRPEDVMRDGRIVILDIPGSVYGPSAQLASVAIKLLFQRAAMRRDLTKACRPLILWCDEAANFCVPEFDAMFLSQSRQFKCICVNIVQNIPLIVTALGGMEAARNQAHAWISNHALVIGAANSDQETNKFLSGLAGEERQTMFGGSSGGGQAYDLFDDFMGRASGNVMASWSEQYRPSLPPQRFLSLAKGGSESDFSMEAYVFQSGRRFSNGRTWIKGEWKQRL